jgi:hypothetical protein
MIDVGWLMLDDRRWMIDVDIGDEKEEHILFWAKTIACRYPWFRSLLDELAILGSYHGSVGLVLNREAQPKVLIFVSSVST